MILRAMRINKKLIPKFNGNDKLLPGEQVVINFNRIPGTVEKSNYKSFKFDQKSAVELIYNDQMMITSFIESIENLTLEIDGKMEKIKNGSDLAKANSPELVDLFTEIRDYLFPDKEDLSEGESKA